MKRAVKVLLVLALALQMLSLAGSAAFAGNPPPAERERIIGPPIEGVLIVKDGVGATFVGQCKKQPVLIAIDYPWYTATFTEADLMHYRIDGAAPPGCFSEAGGENLIITGVQKFINYLPPTGAENRDVWEEGSLQTARHMPTGT